MYYNSIILLVLQQQLMFQ